MKQLTKEWAKKYELLRFIHSLKEYDVQNMSYEEIKSKSKLDFNTSIEEDKELAKMVRGTEVVDKLFQSQTARYKNAIDVLPNKIIKQLKNVKTLILGYACKEDKNILTCYASQVLESVESTVKIVNASTKIAEDILTSKIDIDELVGELIFKECSKDKNYYLSIGDNIICIEDFEIVEREDFKINKWEEDNPLTLWTAVHSAELYYICNNCYELHLLLVDGDKYANEKFWYFTLKGSNIKKV